MKIQEIKIDGVIYVPDINLKCSDCAFADKDCVLNHGGSLDITVCNIFDGHALKVKED